MRRSGFFLGLDTAAERQVAQGLAARAYESARTERTEKSIAYSTGILDAILFLAEDEGADDLAQYVKALLAAIGKL